MTSPGYLFYNNETHLNGLSVLVLHKSLSLFINCEAILCVVFCSRLWNSHVKAKNKRKKVVVYDYWTKYKYINYTTYAFHKLTFEESCNFFMKFFLFSLSLNDTLTFSLIVQAHIHNWSNLMFSFKYCEWPFRWPHVTFLQIFKVIMTLTRHNCTLTEIQGTPDELSN